MQKKNTGMVERYKLIQRSIRKWMLQIWNLPKYWIFMFAVSVWNCDPTFTVVNNTTYLLRFWNLQSQNSKRPKVPNTNRVPFGIISKSSNTRTLRNPKCSRVWLFDGAIEKMRKNTRSQMGFRWKTTNCFEMEGLGIFWGLGLRRQSVYGPNRYRNRHSLGDIILHFIISTPPVKVHVTNQIKPPGTV